MDAIRAARRIIEPEWLETLSEAGARPVLRDLARINSLLGGHSIARRLIAGLVPPGRSFTLLDAGAASGDMAAAIQSVRPGARVTLLDRRREHIGGASGRRVAADAFALPFAPGSFDVVFCSLFLHHFDDARVVELLRGFRAAARLALVAIDLRRTVHGEWFLPLTQPLLGWHPVTVHDGRISVRASFTAPEFERLARAAGLGNIRVRTHEPWSRLSLVAQ